MKDTYRLQLNRILLELGASELDAKVYILVLEKGNISVSSVARELKVERPTVYAALQRLQKLGLIPTKKTPFSRYISIEPPSIMLGLIEKQKTLLNQDSKNLEAILPDLTASFAEKSRDTTLRVFEGKEQFLTIFEESLREAKEEILFYGNAENFVLYEGIDYEKQWIAKRIKKNLPIRMLVFPIKNKKINEMEDSNKVELREVKNLKSDYGFKTSFMIYGFKTVLWNPLAERAVILDDPHITEMFKQTFEMIWVNTK